MADPRHLPTPRGWRKLFSGSLQRTVRGWRFTVSAPKGSDGYLVSAHRSERTVEDACAAVDELVRAIGPIEDAQQRGQLPELP